MLNKIFGLFGDKSSASSEKDENQKAGFSQDSLNEHYKTLGLEPGTDLATARRVWKQELAKVHRDLYSDDKDKKQKAQERTHHLNHAYRALQDALF